MNKVLFSLLAFSSLIAAGEPKKGSLQNFDFLNYIERSTKYLCDDGDQLSVFRDSQKIENAIEAAYYSPRCGGAGMGVYLYNSSGELAEIRVPEWQNMMIGAVIPHWPGSIAIEVCNGITYCSSKPKPTKYE